MAIIKCKMCGGDMELSPDKTFGTCEYCGSVMTLPKVDDDQRAAQFNRGNHFRRQGEFDKALAVYERIVAVDDTDAEAHWCCALCRFGIEYVEDPATYEYIPTCHRASFDSFLEDVDYLAAVEHSDGITRRQYQKDGAKIAEVQRAILATSQKEEPFDVFICYKETDDETKERTRDSLDAQEIYYNLTQEGYRVFFARITLEDKAGTEYEPYIFAALNSAKVMVVVGEKAEYFSAVWVKNEWSRFLSLMRKDRTKLLLPCYKNVDPYDLPEQLGVLQSYDMAKIGFMQDLIRGIKKVLQKDEPKETVKETVVVQQSPGGANITAQLKRGMQALEDKDWAAAEGFFDKALDMDAECAEAFFGKALAAHRVSTGQALVQRRISQEPSESKAERFTACARDDARINAAVEKYRVPGYLEESEIRGYYRYDQRTYPSMVKAWKDRLAEEAPFWEGDRNLSRALRYSKGDFAETLRQYREEIEAVLKKKLAESEAEAKQAAEDTAKSYADAMAKAEKAAEDRKKESEQRKESDYQELCRQQKAGKTQADFSALSTRFSNPEWQGYKDCAERAEQCRAEAEKIRVAAEKATATAKKKKTTIGVIAAAVAVVIIAAALVVTKVIVPANKYKAAEALLAAGNYDGAIAAFVAMGDYKNSAEMINEAKLQKAEKLLNSEDYDTAYALLSEINREDVIISSKRDRADVLIDSEDYETAYTLLSEIGDNDRINMNKKDRAIALIEAGVFNEAYELLNQIGDSATINNSKYERGISLLAKGDYDVAYTLLYESGHMDIANSSKYERAMASFDNGDYENAIALLQNLHYRDSEDQLEKVFIAKYGKETYTLLKTVKNAAVGDTITFGLYEQDNNLANGPEGIEWIILEKLGNNGMTLYVISKHVLDCQPYHSDHTIRSLGWPDSDIKTWLSTTFQNSAFSEEEKSIASIGALGLLDANRIEKYFPNISDRQCKPTTYAIEKGVGTTLGEGTCNWWIRSAEKYSSILSAQVVDPDGNYEKTRDWFMVDSTSVGVRPVVTIGFSSLG